MAKGIAPADQGILRLELAKETYERAGLVGKPLRDGGRKHIKTRYVVEINSRLPSMLHGKKGFERIVWAFKNVLNNSVTWLFYDFEAKDSAVADAQPDPRPIAKHHPIPKTVVPTIRLSKAVLVPPLDTLPLPNVRSDLEDWGIEFHEWLSLVTLGSHRVQANDAIDPYLCRYSVPQKEFATTENLIRLRWLGFLSAQWVRLLFLELIKACAAKPHAWFALNASAIKTEAIDGQDGYTILRLPTSNEGENEGNNRVASEADGDTGDTARPGVGYMLWELASASDGRQ
ncbi:Ribonuclease P protein subunit p40 [Hypocenomyce scalaris]|nr:Ribonuclease P protein subunit p40 [Hypocenomyce scalaris]